MSPRERPAGAISSKNSTWKASWRSQNVFCRAPPISVCRRHSSSGSGSSNCSFPTEADLYVTTRESTEDPWEPPQNLGPNVNTPYLQGQPSISANGRTLYWDSDRPDGLGNFDIWMATRAAFCDTFGPAVNVGPPVNTPGPDFGRPSARTIDNCSSRRAGRATWPKSTSGWSNEARTGRGQVRGGFPSTSIP